MVLLTWAMPIGHATGVGQEPRIDLDRAQPAEEELLDDMVDDRLPNVQLGDLEPEQRAEILGRELEEGPLVALEVGAEGEAPRGQRVEPQGVQHLDPHVDVAVGLRPGPLDGVEAMGTELVGGERKEGGGHGGKGRAAHGHSWVRTPAGQPSGSGP